jgi:hypothetical protein
MNEGSTTIKKFVVEAVWRKETYAASEDEAKQHVENLLTRKVTRDISTDLLHNSIEYRVVETQEIS